MERHDTAQKVALRAEQLDSAGQVAEAKLLYRDAAQLELEALQNTPSDKRKTFSIIGLSCLSLFYKADEPEAALQVSRLLLSERHKLLPYYLARIEEAFDIFYSERYLSKSEHRFANRGMEIRLLGGEIGVGIAPADLFSEIVDAWQTIAVRVTEYLGNYKYRTRGFPSPELRRLLNPQIATLSPASLRFALVLGQDQSELFSNVELGHRIPRPEEVIERTVAVVSTLSAGDLKGLKELVTSPDYRRIIAQLLRKAMPSNRFAESYVSAIGPRAKEESVRLTPVKAKIFENALRQEIEGPQASQLLKMRGRLRGLELNQEWIHVVDKNEVDHYFSSRGIAIDDVIGPLVNREVIVTARAPKPSFKPQRPALVDIESAEAVETSGGSSASQ